MPDDVARAYERLAAGILALESDLRALQVALRLRNLEREGRVALRLMPMEVLRGGESLRSLCAMTEAVIEHVKGMEGKG